METKDLKIGGRYNWRNQPERLTYMGSKFYPGDRRRWHQFALVSKPGVCWSEVLDEDIQSFEESGPPSAIEHLASDPDLCRHILSDRWPG